MYFFEVVEVMKALSFTCTSFVISNIFVRCCLCDSKIRDGGGHGKVKHFDVSLDGVSNFKKNFGNREGE